VVGARAARGDVHPRGGLAAKLHAQFPTATTLGGMFAAVFRHVAGGNSVDFAARLAPAVRGLHPDAVQPAALEVCCHVLGTLLQGALLERGATVEDSLGSPSIVLRLGDERVDTLETLRRFAKNADGGRAALEQWVERLERAS